MLKQCWRLLSRRRRKRRKKKNRPIVSVNRIENLINGVQVENIAQDQEAGNDPRRRVTDAGADLAAEIVIAVEAVREVEAGRQDAAAIASLRLLNDLFRRQLKNVRQVLLIVTPERYSACSLLSALEPEI